MYLSDVVRKANNHIQDLEVRLEVADVRFRRLQEQYYIRGARLASLCTSRQTLGCRETKLLARCLGDWKVLTANEVYFPIILTLYLL